MKIHILLPHKEKFDIYKASSVSITVQNNILHSCYKNIIRIYGQETENPILKDNFIGIKNPFFFKSKNKNLAKKMCDKILLDYDESQIIEIHNRPHLLKIVSKYLKNNPKSLFFHNDPQSMLGSKTIKERAEILENVNAVFCVSEFIKSKFLEGLSENRHRVHVIHNGVQRHLKFLPTKLKEIIFIGRIVPEKGVDLYVNAITKIAKNFPDWKFRIVGSTYLGSHKKKTNFEKKIIEKFKKIGNQAIIHGFVDNKTVQKIMEKASIIIIPSKWEEPFGLVVAEAMSNGLAIISSKVGGIPEIIKKNGIVIKDISEKKIQKSLIGLLKDKKLLQKYQKLSWNNFSNSSINSSRKLDDYRKKIMFKQ